MTNYFDQFDALTATAAPPNPAPSAPTQPAQSASPNYFDQFDQAQPAAGRDALGGYLLPQQQPDPQQAQQPTSMLGRIGHAIDSGVRSVEQGATFGFGDEINAAEQAAEQPLLGNGSAAPSFSQRYNENLQTERTRMADIPLAVSIPGQLVGGAATIAAGAPAAVARGALGAARLIPGANALLDVAGAGGEAVANALSNIPGASYFAPAAKVAAEGGAYGAAQGFGDGEGGFDQRLQSAGVGAATGAVLAPVVAGAGNLVAKGVSGAGRMLSEAGFGPKNALADVGGQPILGTDGKPVTATPGVVRVAGQQIADSTADLPAAKAALDAHVGSGWGTVAPYTAPDGAITTVPPDQYAAFAAGQPPPPRAPLLPGDQATTYQVTGDYGQGQMELGLRNTKGTDNSPGPSEAFLKRAADQNAMRVSAISQVAPDTASSTDLANGLTQQQTALAAQRDAAVAQARTGTLQDLSGASDSTPTLAGAGLRGAVDQARAPVLQQADVAVQQGQARATGALDTLGGVPAGDAGTAQQQYGQQFRGVLSGGDAAAKANVTRLANAIDPDGNLAVDMTPIRARAREIASGMSPNDDPPAGKEAGIMQTALSLPNVQSFQDLAALRSRLTTAISQERGSPTGNPLAVRRMAMLLDGVHDAMADTASRPDVPVPAASPAATPTTAPNVGSDVFTPSGQRVGVQYEVADAPSLVTSHNADMTPNPAFPPELQPRARDRAASEVQVANIASRLQPERLGASSTVADGAPIVGPDGIVESGNGRVMALRRAYQANGPQAQSYRDWLANQGHDTTGMQQPVLIRRRVTDLTPEQRVAFADGGNAPTTLAMSSTERAAGDARRLPDDVLHQVQPGAVTDPANRDFVRGFLRHAVEPGQEGSFVTGDGQLSQDGAARVRAALVHRAYGDAGLSAALSESTDPTAKVLAGAMQDAAGPMARLRAGIQAGHVDPAVDLAPHLVEAADTVAQARAKGVSLADAVGQRDMLGGGVSPRAETLLRAAYGPDLTGRMSRENMTRYLETYAKGAGEQSTSANLFGANLTADQLMEGASARYGKSAGQGTYAPSDAGGSRSSLGAGGDRNGRPLDGPGGQAAPGAGGGPGSQASSRILEQPTPPLTANFDQAAADRYQAMRAAHAERKDTYGSRVPGVGSALASGPQAGTFRMPDSAVPSAIFSRGAGAGERVQAAVRAGLTPSQIADYAAFDLRRAASNPDGSLNPTAAAKWRQQNGEAFQALTQADPTIAGRFDTAQQQAARLADLQTQRAALDDTHPLKPGWGDAEVMQRVWQPGPKGADSVRTATSAAGGSPVAASSVADYAAYSLRKAAAPDGVLDPAKYAAWAKTYDGALSARPDIKAQFDTAASAQQSLNTAAEQHAIKLRDFQAGVAKHFLGGADAADKIGQILNSATRQRDMADLARLTANDPDARAGIQRAVVDHIYGRLQGNALAGDTGTRKLKSDQFQTFVNRAGPALHDVMSPQQVDTLRRVALTLQRDNLSVDGTRVAGGSDTTQKAALLVSGTPGATLMNMVRAHGLTGLMTVLGARMGPVGAFMGNKGGQALGALKSAGIKQTGDLVKEAMLNPALARVLLENLTPATERDVAHRAVSVLAGLSATRGAHTAVAVQHIISPPVPPGSSALSAASMPPPTRMNALAGIGAR